MKGRIEIETEVDMCFTKIANRLGRAEAHAAKVSGNTQNANINDLF